MSHRNECIVVTISFGQAFVAHSEAFKELADITDKHKQATKLLMKKCA